MASRRSDLRILCSGAIAAALAFAAVGAAAQTPSQSGLRTLSWPGKAEVPRAERAGASRAAPARAAATAESAPPRVQPSVLPDYTAAAPVFPRGLTPATAFGAPAVVRGGAAYASSPSAYQPAPAPTVQTGPVVQTAVPQTPVHQTPVHQTPVPQTPVPQTSLPQTPVASPRTQPPPPADDPMAPRADAPIWSLMGSERTAAAPAARPPAPQPVDGADRDGARYYSVHRQAGRSPDPTTLPAPFFLDSTPVDLAEPPPPPTLMRQGGLAPSVADTGL